MLIPTDIYYLDLKRESHNKILSEKKIKAAGIMPRLT
jgi:hypothetical protein